jgi:hypothetical protein
VHRRSLFHSSLLSTVLLVLTASAVLGHECFIANRSDEGNRAAGEHSRNWHTVDIRGLFAEAHFITPQFGICIEPLSPPQIDSAVAMAAAAGIPTTPTVFARASQTPERPQGVSTIGENSPAYTEGDKAGDGKGVDWFFTTYSQQLIGIVLAVATPTECP